MSAELTNLRDWRPFRLNVTILMLTGFWPFAVAPEWRRMYNWGRYSVYGSMVGTVTFQLLAYVYTNEHIFDLVYVKLQEVAFFAKFFMIVFYMDRLNKLIETMACEEFNFFSEAQLSVIEKFTQTGYTNCKIWYCLAFLCITSLHINPLLEPERRLQMSFWFPWDFLSSPSYEILFSISVLLWYYVGVLSASIEIVCTNLIVFLGGQLMLLADSLRNLRQYAKQRLPEATADELNAEVYNDVVKCVRQHIKVFEFLKELETVYNEAVFVIFSCSLFVICGTTYELSTKSFSEGLLYTSATYFLVTMQQVYMYCWYGNELYLKSLEVVDAAYESEWEDCDARTKVAIWLIMERAKRPMALRAGYLVLFKIETFLAILQTTYSFYTVLQSVING